MGILVGMSCMTIFRFCIYVQTRITTLHQKYHRSRILKRQKLNKKNADMLKNGRRNKNDLENGTNMAKNKIDKINNVNECKKN